MIFLICTAVYTQQFTAFQFILRSLLPYIWVRFDNEQLAFCAQLSGRWFSVKLARFLRRTCQAHARSPKTLPFQSGYPEMVKRQALGVAAGAGPAASLMSPWNMTQQLALQGALAGQGAVAAAQPQLLTSSTLREYCYYNL